MILGYSRTSTVEQIAGLEAQQRDLEAAGCERIWAEHVSAVAAERPALAQALEFARDGDVLIVTKLDRLARSVADLLQIVAELERKKVALRILGLGLDTSTATGRLILSILGAIAEFERALMRERQLCGIAAAKKAGR
jgi:DNA invertase Pin-like site-specific DNA recombinase